jgi:hypothetical protein
MATLPLFPLGTVLLPGARLPLQIFEPRYVALLRDLLAGQEERSPVFGVVAIREGYEVGDDGVRALHPIGCAALLTQAAALENERFFVVSEVDGDAAAVAELAARLRAALVSFATTVGATELELADDDRLLSYSVPQTVSLDVGDRQRLLECVDTESRLRLGLALVKREKEFAATLGAVANPPSSPPNLN